MKLKAKILLSGLMVSGILLSGCSNQKAAALPRTSQGDATTVNADKTSTVNYQNLNKTDKQDVKFNFDANKTQDKGNVVTVTVKNNSDKAIKIDKSKFGIYLDDNHYATPDETGTVKVMPNKQVKLENLFINVPSKMLSTVGYYFIYQDSDNRLKSADIMKNNDNNKSNSNQTQTNTTSNSSSKTATPNTNNQKPKQNTNRVINSAHDAMLLYMHAYNMSLDSDQLNVTEVANGYSIDNPNAPQTDVIVTYNGNFVDQNGNVIAYYNQISGATANDPNGVHSNSAN